MMKNDYTIKCWRDGQIKEGILKVLEKGDDIIIDFTVDELKFVRKGDNYFTALVEVRKELEEKKIKLLCKGCCLNVYPSPMSFDMCGGLIAYTMKMGKEIDRRESVNIFDECSLEEYATIEEQLLFCKQWYEDIQLVRQAAEEK